MEKRILTNGNFEEMASLLPREKALAKKDFNKINALKKEQKKKWSNKHFRSQVNKLSKFDQIQFMFWRRIQFIHEKTTELSYESKYQFERAKLKIEYIFEKDKLNKDAKKSFLGAWQEVKKTSKMKEENKKENNSFKKELAALKANKNESISHAKSERKAKNISRDGYKGEVQRNRLLYRGDKHNLKTQRNKYNSQQNLLYSFHQSRRAKKKLKQVYSSKLTFLANRTPSDLRNNWRQFVSPILEFICPGLGSIVNKEYFKGIILLCITGIIYFMTIGFASGMVQVEINGEMQGDGLMGLFYLGSQSDTFMPDSRFHLVFGVISVIAIFINIAYNCIFTRVAYKKSKALWSGFRGNGKIELKNYLNNQGFPYFVATPIYLIIIFTSIFPLLTSMLIVFTNYGARGHVAPVQLITWVGFDNLKEIFDFKSTEGKYFLKTLTWSFLWGVGSTFTAMFAGIGLALLVNHPRLKGKKTIRVLFLLPTAIPFFIMVLYFKIFFGPTGTMNHDVVPAFAPWKEMTTFEIAPGIHQEFANLPWFSKAASVKLLLFAINVWFGFAGTFLFITGLLQGISKDLYEAADISGASSLTKFSKITSPIILYQIAPILIGAFIGGFNNFGLIYLFTEGGPQKEIGGPGETDILASYVFKLVRDKGKPALAATYMFAIAILFGGMGLAGFSRTKTFRKAM